MNYSIFLYEVKKERKTAIKVAEDCHNQALEKMNIIDEETYRNAKGLVDSLKNNITTWNANLLNDCENEFELVDFDKDLEDEARRISTKKSKAKK